MRVATTAAVAPIQKAPPVCTIGTMAAETSTAPGACSSQAAMKRCRPSQRMARKPPPLAAIAASAITKIAIRFSGLADIALLRRAAQAP